MTALLRTTGLDCARRFLWVASSSVSPRPGAPTVVAIWDLTAEIAGRAAPINEARALYEKLPGERLVGAKQIVSNDQAKGDLRPRLRAAEAIDIVRTLIEPSLWLRLVQAGREGTAPAGWLVSAISLADASEPHRMITVIFERQRNRRP